MNVRLRLASLLPCAVLLSAGCIIVDDDDDDGTTTVAATSGQTTSDSSGQTTSGTTDAESGSSGLAESGSSGVTIDCSQCDAEQQPDALCFSEYDAAADVCVCDAGYTFESSDPAGDSNFACERADSEPPKGGCGSDPNNEVDENGNCVCVEGWEFCTADPDDYSCCAV